MGPSGRNFEKDNSSIHPDVERETAVRLFVHDMRKLRGLGRGEHTLFGAVLTCPSGKWCTGNGRGVVPPLIAPSDSGRYISPPTRSHTRHLLLVTPSDRTSAPSIPQNLFTPTPFRGTHTPRRCDSFAENTQCAGGDAWQIFASSRNPPE